jgi:DNA-binding NarL/FixJ family response regulator
MRWSVLMVGDGSESASVASLLFRADGEINYLGSCRPADLGRQMLYGACPDVVLVDQELGPMSQLVASIHRLWHIARVLVVGDGGLGHIVTAARAGAHGYILLSSSREEIIEALDETSSGMEFVVPSALESAQEASLGRAPHAAGRRKSAPHSGRLTAREQEILGLLRQGLSNRQVAQSLFISDETARWHVKNVLHKLGLRSRFQLMAAAEVGLTQSSDQRARAAC